MQRARANVAETHAEGRTARSQSLVFWTRKRLIGSVAIDGCDSSTPTKTLGQLWLSHNGFKIKFQIWLNKMTRHISEAEASQKIIAGAQTKGIIAERAIESSVIGEKQRGFFYFQTAEAQQHLPFASSQRFTSSQSPAGPLTITAIFVSEQMVLFLSSYLQPVVKSCRHVIGSHAPIIGWAETSSVRGARHHVHFRH